MTLRQLRSTLDIWLHGISRLTELGDKSEGVQSKQDYKKIETKTQQTLQIMHNLLKLLIEGEIFATAIGRHHVYTDNEAMFLSNTIGGFFVNKGWATLVQTYLSHDSNHGGPRGRKKATSGRKWTICKC